MEEETPPLIPSLFFFQFPQFSKPYCIKQTRIRPMLQYIRILIQQKHFAQNVEENATLSFRVVPNQYIYFTGLFVFSSILDINIISIKWPFFSFFSSFCGLNCSFL